MSGFLAKIEPVDLIALVVIVGGLGLKFGGADGTVGTLLTMVVGFYFGRRIIPIDSLPRTRPTDKQGLGQGRAEGETN